MNEQKPLSGERKGTLFTRSGNPWGYDTSMLSDFPDEKEILLEPERNLDMGEVYEFRVRCKLSDASLSLSIPTKRRMGQKKLLVLFKSEKEKMTSATFWEEIRR